MPIPSTTHNTTLLKESQQIPFVTEKITMVAEKPSELEKSIKNIPMETSSTGWHNYFEVLFFILVKT
jgi:hypothetical protein